MWVPRVGMIKRYVLIGPIVFLAALFPVEADPFFTGLGDLPGGSIYSRAMGISADGLVVVGDSHSTWDDEAFRWTEARGMVGFGNESRAFDASADGSVVVGLMASGNPYEAFRWMESGGMVGLGDLPGGSFYSHAIGVSADGAVVVGASNTDLRDEAFRWTESSGMVGLGDLPGGGLHSGGMGISADGSVIVGTSGSEKGDEAFRWTEPGGMVSLGYLPGGSIYSTAMAVSADGSVVVGLSRSAEGEEAFRWTESGGMVGLSDLPGGRFRSYARDVSADGSVVVGFGNSDKGEEAFLWDATHGMYNLKEVLVNDYGLDLNGWTLRAAEGISGDGLTIVGYGYNPSGQTEAWIAHLGEPALQPDLWIKQGETWLGEGIYNADGTDQTGTQKVVTGTPAVYQAQLYNDGDTTDTFWVQGTEGNADWTVEYYAGTEVLEAQKVTAQVTSPEGWEISDLPPGEGENFIITVTPNAGVAGSYPVLVTATSNLDDTLVDAIQAVTTEWPVTEGENGHYYEAVLVPEGIDWNQANAAAIAAGGYLATITSEEENELVYNLVKGTAFWRWPQGPWLGGRQQEGMEEPAAGWEWVTGETWDYTPWYDGEPNDYFEEIDEDRLNFEHGATWNDFPQTELTNGYVVEYMEAHWQPDLWIKSAGSWQGDDIYHPTGENQVGRRKVEGGTTVKYLARLYNDGDEAANFWIHGPGGDADWTVQYYRGTQVDPAKEVTAQVTSGLGWKRANVPPGARRSFVIAVTPTSGVVGDCAVLVKATSEQDLAQVDCIQAITTVPDVQPDLHIKKGPVWGGDDIYNDDGTGQKASRKVTAGSSALFRARLENDGNGKDHFYIFGPSGNEDWTVQYYRGAKIDAAKEVTADVTSAEGWKRPNVAPGKMRSFLIVVTPRSGVAAGEQYEALVRAEAKRDPYQSDALKTVTTVKEE